MHKNSLQDKATKQLMIWDDLAAPFFRNDHYTKRFKTLEATTAQLSEKYYKSARFAPWQPHRSNAEIEHEFLVLTKLRTEAWFEVTEEEWSSQDLFEAGRNWREDFAPAYSLLAHAFVRNFNCIAFESNALEFYNGSLVECNGKRFLAVEGPQENNLHLFFLSLLNAKVPMVVRLTPEIENGGSRCVNYWEGNMQGNLVGVPMNLKGANKAAKWIDFLATDLWVDGQPANVDLLLELVDEIQTRYRPTVGPLAVHCSAGVGRTGTLIAAYLIAEEIDRQIEANVSIKDLKFSIPQIVAHLSLQRFHMVSNVLQYLNLYHFADKYVDRLRL